MQLVLNLKKRLLLLAFFFVIAFFIVSVISAFIVMKFGPDYTPACRILAVLQDVLMFITPAILTAYLVTRQPATLLCIDKGIPAYSTIVAICVLVASIPAMNCVIWLNQQLPLPEALAQQLRAMEHSADAMIAALQGPHTVPNLIMSILIVGVFAGLSEELLFRGALQRLLSTGGINKHAAIWIAAVVFSLLHMQFYGFVPRMLLGAFFGYLLLWTGSLWVPIIVHSSNNILYLIGQWIADGGESAIDSIGAGNDYWQVTISAVMVAFGLSLLRRNSLRQQN